jgi:hypothetical protein
MVDTLEPDRDVRDEGNLRVELAADFTLVDVVCQRVGDYVAGEILDVILW